MIVKKQDAKSVKRFKIIARFAQKMKHMKC